ncbi:MAG: metallophosphoesterase family protein [Gammaproteobacteria bacterium]|nr:metallophosphoesterase family protein [Gammaproteobacteria bacterium]
MSVLELGSLAGPLVVFGGPYSNLAATQAMKKVAQEMKLSPQQVICTGDIVAYCAEPEETIKLVQDWGIHVVMGNCEESVAYNKDDCGCGFEEGSACDLLSDNWYRYASSHISKHSKEWMKQLPERIHFTFNNKSFCVIHGGVSEKNRFIFHSTDTNLKRDEIHHSGSDVVIAGHCGIPFGQQVDNNYWLNAGVIGMPANDGTQNGWYLILQAHGDTIQACWKILKYDYIQAFEAMQSAGLSHHYADALKSGIWPSMEVLPTAERQNKGHAIMEKILVIH